MGPFHDWALVECLPVCLLPVLVHSAPICWTPIYYPTLQIPCSVSHYWTTRVLSVAAIHPFCNFVGQKPWQLVALLDALGTDDLGFQTRCLRGIWLTVGMTNVQAVRITGVWYIPLLVEFLNFSSRNSIFASSSLLRRNFLDMIG